MRILVDTNVLLDSLLGRQPYYDEADAIIRLCAERKVQGYMAAHSIPNMFYILRKDFSEDDRREVLLNLGRILIVDGIDSSKIIAALSDKSFSDFEDCLQSKCAESVNADYIVTRNVKDFSNSKVRAVLPNEFLKVWKK